MKKALFVKCLCLLLTMFIFSQAEAKPRKSTKKSTNSSRYNTLTNWRLDDKFRPSVTLRLTNGKTLTLVFERQNGILVIPDKQELIPEGTRFTVPKNYMALCNFYHTECVSGKATRTQDSDGTVRTLFEQEAVVDFIRPSGLIMVSYADIAVSQFATSSLVQDEEYKDEEFKDKEYKDEEDEEPEEPKEPVTPTSQMSLRKRAREYENRSVKPEDVIKTYGLSESEAENLIISHKDALRLLSNEGKVEAYERIFAENSFDYLAAYGVALAHFNMNQGGQSVSWCDKALAVNPLYYPAKALKRRAEGLMK